MRSITVSSFAVALVAAAAAISGAHAAQFSETSTAWTYNRSEAAANTNGPFSWHTIINATDDSRLWPLCNSTARQSPINFAGVQRADRSLGPLQHENWSDSLRWNMTNNGKTYRVQPVDADSGGFMVDPSTSRRYNLRELQFFAPSEHTFGGSNRDGEIQFLHTRADGTRLAVAVTLRVTGSGYNKALVPMIRQMEATAAGQTSTASLTRISLPDLMPADPSYYVYDGSETAPPCSENVRWIVLRDAIDISSDMLTVIRQQLGANSMSWSGRDSFETRGNWRPTQASLGRQVRMYSPGGSSMSTRKEDTSVEDKTRVLAASGTIVGSMALCVAVMCAVKLLTIPTQHGPKVDGKTLS